MSEPELRATYELRYEGQAFELPVDGDPRPDPAELRRAFDRAHEDRYGYSDPDANLELVTIRVAVALPGAEPRPAEWDGLPAEQVEGPRGRGAARLDARHPRGLARPRRGGPRGDGTMSDLDPITLQVLLGSLRAACDEMGAVLVRSAHSANIKERRDASTALFDPDGQMVMQAEHIPVHLGAMPSASRPCSARSSAPASRGSSTTPTGAAPTCPTSR